MKHRVLFGPAGSPINYKGAAYKAPKYINEEGLDSYEYQSPYGVRIGESAATTLKEESQKHDVTKALATSFPPHVRENGWVPTGLCSTLEHT